MKAMFRRVFCVLLVLASLCPFVQAEETSLTPREQLIEDILAEAKALFDNAKGRVDAHAIAMEDPLTNQAIDALTVGFFRNRCR